MKRQILTYCFLIFLKFGFSQENNPICRDSIRIAELDSTKWSFVGKMAFNSVDSLLKIDPVDYLKYLGTFKYQIKDSLVTNLQIHNNKFPSMISWKFTINNCWITKRDVDSLIKYIYSKQPAHMPWPMISSTISNDKTTIGIEALHLINIYRHNDFHYPSLCSTYYFCKPDNQDRLANEFIEWWEKNK
jgi:hypothetical protein